VAGGACGVKRVEPTLPGILGILGIVGIVEARGLNVGSFGIAIPSFSSSEKKADHMTLAVF
jgi:hypothetical protein